MTTWGDIAANISGTKLVRHAVLTVGGTWEPGPGTQYPSNVVQGVNQFINPDLVFEVPIDYPAAFGPVSGPINSPSYQQSVDIAVETVGNWITDNPYQTFALAGYSQGAEVVSRIAIELMSGSLTGYLDNLIGGYTFGNPCRGSGFIAPGVADPGGHGISSINMTQRPTVNGKMVWADYVHSPANGDASTDIYGCVPSGQVGRIMTDAYGLGTELQLTDLPTFFKDMLSDIMKLVEDSGVLGSLAKGVPGLLGLGSTALFSLLVGLVTGPQANATGVSADVSAALIALKFLTAPGGAVAPHLSYLGEIPGYSNLVGQAMGFLTQIATLTPARSA